MRFLHPHGESAFLYAQPRKRRGASQPSEMAYCGHASEAKPEAQLGASETESDEPRSVVASHHR